MHHSNRLITRPILVTYRVLSRDVTSAILVFQINPEGIELFCNAENYCFIKKTWALVTNTLVIESRILDTKSSNKGLQTLDTLYTARIRDL